MTTRRYFARLLSNATKRATKSSKLAHKRLRLDSLEDRTVPATFLVSNDADSGAGSLRQAILDANGSSGPDDVQFHSDFFTTTDGVIDLTSGTLAINTDDLSILNPSGPSTVRVNRASGTFGVFTIATSATDVTIDGLTITGGNGGLGSAISNSNATNLTVSNSVISGNTNARGAIDMPSGSSGLLTVVNSTISGNTNGTGAIYFYSGGSLLIQSSTISGNTGTAANQFNGGAIVFYGTIGSAGFTVENSTIHGNSSADPYIGGGAIAFSFTTGNATIRNSTITGNTGSAGAIYGGGGIGAYGAVNIDFISSIVAQNSGPAGLEDVGVDYAAATGNDSFFGVQPTTNFTDNGGNLGGTTGAPLDPLLRPLGNSGGPTQTRVPEVGSPVLNVGNDSGGTITTDQRGFSRTFGGVPDMGSVERQLVDANPFATGSAPDITVGGGTSHTVTVVFEDTDGALLGMDILSIINNSNAVRVTGPNGYDEAATFVSVDFASDGSPRTATYSIPSSGAEWDGADNGVYSIEMQASQVFDLDGNSVPAGSIGGFSVFVPLVLTVTNANDSGAGSLRDAILQTNFSPTDDTILFDPSFFASPQTITLGSVLAVSNGDLIIQNSTGAANVIIDGNTGGFGMFLVATSTPNLHLEGLTMTNASGGTGGVVTLNNVSNVEVVDSVITGNSGGLGGAIAVPTTSSSMVSVINSTISNNVGGTGGIYFFIGGSLLVSNSTISGNIGTANSPFHAGAIVFYGTVGGGGFTIESSTIDGNSTAAAYSGGGAIGFTAASGTAVIRNSTITGNTAPASADTAGGIGLYYSSLTLNITSSVIALNSGPASPDLESFGGSSSITASTSFIGVLPTANFDGADTLTGDPLLGALQDNGGPTETRAPQAGSPLLDVGAAPSSLFYDQRGFGYVRSYNGAPDIGSYEEQPLGIPFALANVTAVDSSNTGETTYTFSVLIGDVTGTNQGLDLSTIIGNDNAFVITSAAGFSAPATFVSIDDPSPGNLRTATYTFTVPGGAWDSTDSGFYTITAVADQIFDIDAPANALPAGTVGVIPVAISPIVVRNADDDGAGSLREAIGLANSTPDDDFISFDPIFFSTPQTISLLSGLPQIVAAGGELTIAGPGVNNLTVDGGGAFRVINSTSPELTLSGFTITGGLADGGLGGGLLQTGGIANLDHMRFEGNAATHGGNIGFNFGGGGAIAGYGAALNIQSTVIRNNTAERMGGGVVIRAGGALIVENSTISGNSTNLDGGAYPYPGLYGGAGITINGDADTTPPPGFTAGTFVIRNSTIANNTTTGSAGGIGFVFVFGSTLLIQNSTISGNNSDATGTGAFGYAYPYGGGAIGQQISFAYIDIRNSIISGNTNPDFPDIVNNDYAPYPGIAYSAIGDVNGLGFSDNGGNLIGADLLLGPLQDNGGPTETMAPGVGSPLIDAGSDALAVGTTDQLGGTRVRIFGDAVDIGSFEIQPPTVTVEQAPTQGDPTNSTSIVFDVSFGGNVTGFDETDVVLSGTNTGTLVATVAGTGSAYTITVTGMEGVGTVVADVVAGAAQDATGLDSLASTSVDNSVLFDGVAPTVTLEKAAGQLDPTNNPVVTFDVVFSEAVLGFVPGVLDTSATTASIASTVINPGVNPGEYTIVFTLNPGEGDVIVSIPAGAVTDLAGNANEAMVSSDNSVHFDNVAPTVTINQASTQFDPSGGISVSFDVVFSEAVVDFDESLVVFSGTAIPGEVTFTGTGPAYVVTASEFTNSGTVIANIPEDVIFDTAGNLNTEATFTDNEVTFINSGVIQLSAATYTVTEQGSPAFIVTASRIGGTEGPLTVNYATSDGTATEVDDYIAASGVLSWAANETGDKTFTISILDDQLFEGDETVNITLSGISLAGALGTPSSAVLTIDDYEEGTVTFSSPTYSVVEGNPPALPTEGVILVQRTDGGDGAISVDYHMLLGTAEATDIGTILVNGVPASANGTLTWADGNTDTYTITVPVIADLISEGSETVNFTLDTLVGVATLGTSNSVLTIDKSDPIFIDASTKFKALSFLDSDNDKIKVSLGGKTGTLNVYQTDGKGPIAVLELIGTTEKSTVTVKVSRASKTLFPTADGKSAIGEIVGGPAKSITAKKSDLIGVGVNLGANYLGSLSVASIGGGADVIAGGVNTQKTKIKVVGTIGDGSDITLGSILSSLSATGYADTDAGVDITAPSIGNITIKGNFSADIDVSGAGVDHARQKKSLNKLTVKGIVDGSNINVVGNIGSVSTYDFLNSRLFGGYVGADDGTTAGGFNTAIKTTISSFKTAKNTKLGLTGKFQNSSVIADTIKTATLADVVTNNGGTDPFGVFADTTFKTVTVTIGGVKTKVKDGAAFSAVGDFDINVV